MAVDRRTFLRISSAAALGAICGRPLLGAGKRVDPAQLRPKSDPLKAERWAMTINTKKCIETKDCMDGCAAACHKAHNVPELPSKKDEVKWIWKEGFEHVLPSQYHDYLETQLKEESLLALCNHCENPPCVRVCPTKATFRRDDGIVMMDQHRCIGCRFCVAACPYGARSFNWRDPRKYIPEIDPTYPTRTKGVVEKCTFCAERLARGEMPACVEACPSKALAFGDLRDKDSDVRKVLKENYTVRRKPELGTEPAVYYVV